MLGCTHYGPEAEVRVNLLCVFTAAVEEPREKTVKDSTSLATYILDLVDEQRDGSFFGEGAAWDLHLYISSHHRSLRGQKLYRLVKSFRY